mgnify:CR=1 FL=1
MTSATGERADRAGFTLIELTLVLALLIVAVGIGAPMLGRTTRAAVLESEAHRILALIERARAEALARAAPTRVWLDPAARRGGWETLPGFDDEAAGGMPLRLREDVEVRVSAAAASKTAAANNERTLAVFDADGEVAAGTDAVATVANARGESLAVRLAEDGWTFAAAGAAETQGSGK